MNEEDKAPVFGTWRRAIFLRSLFFAIEVVLLYIFTVRFS